MVRPRREVKLHHLTRFLGAAHLKGSEVTGSFFPYPDTYLIERKGSDGIVSQCGHSCQRNIQVSVNITASYLTRPVHLTLGLEKGG